MRLRRRSSGGLPCTAPAAYLEGVGHRAPPQGPARIPGRVVDTKGGVAVAERRPAWPRPPGGRAGGEYLESAQPGPSVGRPMARVMGPATREEPPQASTPICPP